MAQGLAPGTDAPPLKCEAKTNMNTNTTMTTMKYVLLLGAVAFLAPFAQAELVDFHFGADTQTGAAAIGSAGDLWNATNLTNGGPVLLKDTTGLATSISVSWTSGDAWAPTKTLSSNTTSTAMDPATNWLMRSAASSYSYKPGATNLTLSLSGLAASQSYTLVLYGSGDEKNEGTIFTVNGASTYTASTSGVDRKISNGPGDAYVVLQVVSSPTGTLKVTTAKGNYAYAVLNGFQLQSSPLIWGVCGHPTWSDYASWIPANITTQYNYLNQLGCTYYRVSFEGAEYPSYLDTITPKAQAAGITLLPILPIKLVASESASANYSANYSIGYNWATYAISKGYALPYWELGNEVENDGLVNVVYDGASPNDFPDAVPGGFVAIANGLTGAYQGIKDAYTAGRNSGLTKLTPQVLIGATYRHWGLLSKIQSYNNGFLPCDLISWHWYGPNYGVFNAAINDPNSASNGLSPAQCLNAFKSHTNPTQPMNIWITETDRSQSEAGGGLLNGSVANNASPATSQNWAAQATAIQANIDSFKAVPSVTGIFVYELLDEPIATGGSLSDLAEEGYFGLVTGLNGTPKNAFYTFQAEIKAGR